MMRNPVIAGARTLRAYIALANADREEVRKHPVQVLVANLGVCDRTARVRVAEMKALGLFDRGRRGMRLVYPKPKTRICLEGHCWIIDRKNRCFSFFRE